MSHFIQCIIGHKNGVQELSEKWEGITVLELNHDFSLIPLTDSLVADINELANLGDTPINENFELLSKSIEAVLKENSYKEPIGYIETEYHGSEGGQVGIAYSKGEILEGPKSTYTSWDNKKMLFLDKPEGMRAINTILYKLGLEERNDIDGFDNLGLGNFRTNEEIIKSL